MAFVHIYCSSTPSLHRLLCLQTDMFNADTSLWVRELDPHGVPTEEARVFPGRAGKMYPEMAKTPI